MVDNKLAIAEDGLYNMQLHVSLWKLKYEPEYPIGLIDLLLKLLAMDLVALSIPSLALDFKDEDLALLQSFNLAAHTKNKELLARWHDIQILFNAKKIAPHLRQVIYDYKSVYQATNKLDYLVRCWAIIKLGKQLVKNDLPGYFDEGVNILLALDSMFWQNALIRHLPNLATYAACRDKLELHFETQIAAFLEINDFDSTRVMINSLANIQSINTHQLHLQLAENFENQADFILAGKPVNTFIPQISERYQQALRELVKVNGSAAIRKRIAGKLQAAQRADYTMVTYGVPMEPAVDMQFLQKKLMKLKLNDFSNAYQLLLNLPITPEELVANIAAKEKDQMSFIAKLFEGTVKLNNKGAPVGFADGDQARLNSARRLLRETTLAYIHLTKDLIDIYGQISKQAIYEQLVKADSLFIPRDRLHVYLIGFYHGFNNDFVSAAHVLMPQIENSLRHIAILNGIVMSNFDKREQFENTLGGCLQKMEEMTEPDLMAELKGFLVEGSDVSFRNELAHGNMHTVNIHHYGKYLWWLALKLVFQTQQYFTIKIDNSGN